MLVEGAPLISVGLPIVLSLDEGCFEFEPASFMLLGSHSWCGFSGGFAFIRPCNVLGRFTAFNCKLSLKTHSVQCVFTVFSVGAFFSALGL